MAGQPDLFVVCKSCGAEVSPYITECPYCGNRLRKRAPKLEKGGVPKAPKARRRPPSLTRLRPGEMPGVRTEGRPLATIALVLGAIVFTVLIRSTIVSINVVDGVEWWRYIPKTFMYFSTAYEACALGTVFVFGWLLERRHGAWATLLVFTLGSAAGCAAAWATNRGLLSFGANAGALALLGAWVVRDLLALRRREEVGSDLLGVAAIAILLLLLPAALDEPQPLSGIAGAVAGLLVGLPLARLRER